MDPMTLLAINLTVLFAIFIFALIFVDGDGAEKLSVAFASTFLVLWASSIGWILYVAVHFIAKYW